MARGQTRLRTFRSFRFGDFRLLWLASLGTSGGFFLHQVLIGWLTYDVTGSALFTGIALGLATLPNLVGAPLGGVIADSVNRRLLLMVVPVGQAALSISFGVMALLEVVEVWHIFAFVLLMGSSWMFLEPARMSSIPGIVGETRLVNAFSLVELAFSSSRLAGPAVGGLILASFGPGSTAFAAAGAQLGAFAMAALMRNQTHISGNLTFSSALSGLAGSARLVSQSSLIQALLLLALIAPMLAVPFSNGLMPVFAAEVFDAGPTQLGVLLSIIGAGAIMGTILIASAREIPRKGYAVLGAMLFGTLGLVILAVSPSFPVAIPAALIIGFGFTSAQTLVASLLQRSVPREYRGRIAGVLMMTWGTVVGGGLIAGALAGLLGAPLAAAIGAGTIVAAISAIATRYRCIQTLK